MTNGARIITNANNLVILCVNTQFGDNSGISSFSTQTLNAGLASVGARKSEDWPDVEHFHYGAQYNDYASRT